MANLTQTHGLYLLAELEKDRGSGDFMIRKGYIQQVIADYKKNKVLNRDYIKDFSDDELREYVNLTVQGNTTMKAITFRTLRDLA